MRLTTLFVTFLVLVRHGWALPAEDVQESVLEVSLSKLKDTRIRAVIKNTGSEEVTFVHLNFFGDSAPVEKVDVYQNGAKVAFEGIRRRLKLEGLASDALTTLAAGEALQDEWDLATTHDLSRDGSVTVRTSGLLPLVKEGLVSGYLPYRSNDLQVGVDAAKASWVDKAIKPLSRRTQESCTDLSRKTTLNQALNNTATLARAAAQAALSAPASKFAEYFKTTADSTRQLVAARLQAVAKEAQSSSLGPTKYFCTDVYGYCEPNVLAYTLPALNVIANCDIYYSYLPALAHSCHNQDQPTTSLHEFTHAPGVYTPGTEDFAYGYAASASLNTSQAVMNADSYALYANAIYLGC